MLFGDYLIKNKLITAQDLLEALCKQQSETPPLLEVLYRSGDFENHQLIQLVKIQNELGIDLVSLILKQSFLSVENLETYLKLQNNNRLPLGQILIEMGKLDIDTCAKALEGFFEIENGVINLSSEKEINATDLVELNYLKSLGEAKKMAIEQDPEVQRDFESFLDREENINSIELPQFSFRDLDKKQLKSFLEEFDVQKRSQLEECVFSWRLMQRKEKFSDLKQSFRFLCNEFDSLKHTSRSTGACLSEFLIIDAERPLAKLVRSQNQVELTLIEDLEDYYLHAIDLLWNCQSSIKNSGSEEKFFRLNESQYSLKKLLWRARLFIEKID